MGNREDLLDGARKAILERGLAKVTARDIANQAGVSLAAIGYHFGSKDQLVQQAILEATGTEIGDGMRDVIVGNGTGHTLTEAAGPTWEGLRALARDNLDTLRLSIENGVNISRSPQAQAMMAEATAHAYADIGEIVAQTFPDLDEPTALAIAKFYFLIFQSVGILALIAPDADLPDGPELLLALRALAGCESP